MPLYPRRNASAAAVYPTGAVLPRRRRRIVTVESAPPRETAWPLVLLLLGTALLGTVLAALYFSQQDETAVVKPVVGLNQTAATARLEDQGFETQRIATASTRPAGTVVSQTPGAGARLGTDQTVVLEVSQGPAAAPASSARPASSAQPTATQLRGPTGYTAILRSFREQPGSHAAANRYAERARAAGVADVGVLRSDRYDSLVDNYWVVYSGSYDTMAAARAAARSQSLSPDAYGRRLAR